MMYRLSLTFSICAALIASADGPCPWPDTTSDSAPTPINAPGTSPRLMTVLPQGSTLSLALLATARPLQAQRQGRQRIMNMSMSWSERLARMPFVRSRIALREITRRLRRRSRRSNNCGHGLNSRSSDWKKGSENASGCEKRLRRKRPHDAYNVRLRLIVRRFRRRHRPPVSHYNGALLSQVRAHVVLDAIFSLRASRPRRSQKLAQQGLHMPDPIGVNPLFRGRWLCRSAYCFMPDHVHLLLEGTSPTSDLPRLIARWKQKTGYAHRCATGAILWQGGFFDHVLRQEEDRHALVRYIIANPIRAGLVLDVRDTRSGDPAYAPAKR